MKGGPGFIVAAAFVGPGTVTTATLAGVQFGLMLLWALAFATFATMVVQEMSARLGLVTGRGLVEALVDLSPRWGAVLAWLSGLAVMFGIVAFEAGNLTGAGLGLSTVTGLRVEVLVFLVALAAVLLLWTGRYRLLERVLVGCVAVMGLTFVATAALVRPDPVELLRGVLVPRVPVGAAVLVLALIGTTVVPYNLFLHAGAVRARWQGPKELPTARRDLVLAIAVGGVVSAAVVVTAAAALGGAEVTSATEMARQLEPLLGGWAKITFGLGFAIAGITSAITAPLAAAFIVLGLMKRGEDLRGGIARAASIGSVATGAALALGGVQPVRLILFAQAANGIILPLVVLALVVALNSKARMGQYANGPVSTVLGLVIVVVCVVIAARNWMG